MRQRSAIMVASSIVFPASVVLVTWLLMWLFRISAPPKEEKLIRTFSAHQEVYERLRNMLLKDKQVLRVASWGVETTDSISTVKPPAGSFPIDRYSEYLSLLKEGNAIEADRARGDDPSSICLMVYASGWAGDTRHVEICWLNHEPENQVATLASFYRTPKPRHPVYRHIESNWYLWTDW